MEGNISSSNRNCFYIFWEGGTHGLLSSKFFLPVCPEDGAEPVIPVTPRLPVCQVKLPKWPMSLDCTWSQPATGVHPSPAKEHSRGKFRKLSAFTHFLNMFHPKGNFSPVTARSMCNHPGGRLPHEIAGGKTQRLVPWQREDKLRAGEGERWSQPKAINSLSRVPQSRTGEEKERSRERVRREGNGCPKSVWGTKTILKMPLAGELERPRVKAGGCVLLIPLTDDSRSGQLPHEVARSLLSGTGCQAGSFLRTSWWLEPRSGIDYIRSAPLHQLREPRQFCNLPGCSPCNNAAKQCLPLVPTLRIP